MADTQDMLLIITHHSMSEVFPAHSQCGSSAQCIRMGWVDGQATVSLLPEPGFIAKSQLPHQVPSWVKIPGINHLSPEDSRENVVPCQETLFILEWYKEHQKRTYKSLHSLEPFHSWYLPQSHIYHSHISKGIVEVIKTAYLSGD